MNQEELIDLFGLWPKAAVGEKRVDFAELNRLAVQRGYLVHPDCCTRVVQRWLEKKTCCHNATFYRTWSEILFKNRFELFLDQIRHYATTYGTDFAEGQGYVPNASPDDPDFTQLKVLRLGTEADFIARGLELLSSGLALKDETMKAVCDFLVENAQAGGLMPDIDAVANREAQAYLACRLQQWPKDEFGLLRCLVYSYTGSCMLIKSRDVLDAVRAHAEMLSSRTRGVPKWLKASRPSPLLALGEEQLVALSRIFRRFKPLFLAMKTKETARVINRLAKLARTHHTPLKPGFWETVLSTVHTAEELDAQLEQADNFKKIRILQAVAVARLEGVAKAYLVRNGRIYVRRGYQPKYDAGYLTLLEARVRASLVASLAEKACRVRYPEHFDLALPSSQKSFVGNLPFGTRFRMTKNNVVGIYWRNAWGTYDFDLSFTDFAGNLVSWCNDYTRDDGQVVYSGDMTNADPHASELLFIKGDCPDGVVRVNRYWGDLHSRFRFFVANEKAPSSPARMRNHMVDPDNVRLDTMVEVDSHGEKVVGLVHANTLTLMDVASGAGCCSRGSAHMRDFIKAMALRSDSYVRLRDILEEAGFVEDEVDPELDLQDPTLDTFVNLLAG